MVDTEGASLIWVWQRDSFALNIITQYRVAWEWQINKSRSVYTSFIAVLRNYKSIWYLSQWVSVCNLGLILNKGKGHYTELFADVRTRKRHCRNLSFDLHLYITDRLTELLPSIYKCYTYFLKLQPCLISLSNWQLRVI